MRASWVQGRRSSQEVAVGQLPSQASPPSTLPSPHFTLQSVSVRIPHEAGQQVSPSTHKVTSAQASGPASGIDPPSVPEPPVLPAAPPEPGSLAPDPPVSEIRPPDPISSPPLPEVLPPVDREPPTPASAPPEPRGFPEDPSEPQAETAMATSAAQATLAANEDKRGRWRPILTCYGTSAPSST